MFPMITSVSEVEKILAICDEVKSELAKDGISYNDNTEIGIMIENSLIYLLFNSIFSFFRI